MGVKRMPVPSSALTIETLSRPETLGQILRSSKHRTLLEQLIKSEVAYDTKKLRKDAIRSLEDGKKKFEKGRHGEAVEAFELAASKYWLEMRNRATDIIRNEGTGEPWNKACNRAAETCERLSDALGLLAKAREKINDHEGADRARGLAVEARDAAGSIKTLASIGFV